MRTNRRRMIRNGNSLPTSLYERLEYIENTSTAYIATGFTPDINSSFLYTFAYRVFTNNDCFGVGGYYKGWGLHTHGGTKTIGYSFSGDLNIHYKNDYGKHSFGIISNQLIYDDKAITFTRKDIDKTYPLLIFCAHVQSATQPPDSQGEGTD